MNAFLFISAIVLLLVAISYLCLWAAARGLGVKATFRSLLLPVIGVEAVTLGMSAGGRLLAPGLRSIVVILGFIAGLIVWHKLLSRQHDVTAGKSIGSYLLGVLLGFIASLFAAIVILGYIQSYQITGPTMVPTLKDGDRVLVFKRNQEYAKGTVVVYHWRAMQEGGQALGRIKAMPGETVQPPLNFVTADGKLASPESYLLRSDEYLVVGDNTAVAPERIVQRKDFVGVVGPTIFEGSK